MDLLFPTLAALGALATAQGTGTAGAAAPSAAGAPAAAVGVGATGFAGAGSASSTVTRFSGGASASFTASARIVRGSARIGAGMAPPLAHMVARPATIAAADGRPVPALIYDFE